MKDGEDGDETDVVGSEVEWTEVSVNQNKEQSETTR